MRGDNKLHTHGMKHCPGEMNPKKKQKKVHTRTD